MHEKAEYFFLTEFYKGHTGPSHVIAEKKNAILQSPIVISNNYKWVAASKGSSLSETYNK